MLTASGLGLKLSIFNYLFHSDSIFSLNISGELMYLETDEIDTFASFATSRIVIDIIASMTL